MAAFRLREGFRTLLTIGTSGLAIAATPALAQDEESPANQQSQTTGREIIVTAQFREQLLQDTPLAITAVDAETMEAKNQTNLAQVADAAPNVSIRPQTSAFGPSVTASIRGIGQNDFNPAYEPGVGIYIDDVYYPQLTGAVFDTLDLERVEILRGPQGTLSGRNSEGGAIKLYSRMPSGDTGGFVEVGYGSEDYLSLRGAAEFPLTDTLFARVAGVAKKRDGYVDQLDFGCVYPAGGGATFTDANGNKVPINPVGGVPQRVNTGDDCRVDKLGGVGYQAVRGILRWTPTDSLEINIIGDYTNDEHTIAGEVLLATAPVSNPNNASPVPGVVPYDDRFICGRYCNFMNNGSPADVFLSPIPPDPFGANGTPLAQTQGDSDSHYSGWGISGQVIYDITDTLQVTSISGYREFDTQFYVSAGLSPAPINFGENDLSNWSFSQEVRLNVDLDPLFLTVGGYYFEQESLYDSAQDIRYVPVYPLQFRQPDPTDAKAKAAFANASWEIIPDLNLTAGVRYTDESKDQTYYRLNYDGTINHFLDPVGAFYGAGFSGPDVQDYDNDGNTSETVSALTGQTASYSADRWDWRVSVDYRFIPEVMVYGTVATGFKGGGSNPRPFNADQLISFAPESVTSYEVGAKTDLFDRRVRLNLAGFYNDFTDIQIPVNVCPTNNPLTQTPCAARLNAGDAKVKGFEAELAAEPVDGLLLDASLSYLDFKYKESTLNPAAAAPPVGTNAGGVLPDDPPFVPPWKVSIGAQYRVELDSAGSITPRLDFTYQDDQYTGPSIINGERILNFIPSFSLLNGRVTWKNEGEDLEVALSVTNITDEYYFLSIFDLRAAGSGFRVGQPGRPREWEVTVKKRF